MTVGESRVIDYALRFFEHMTDERASEYDRRAVAIALCCVVHDLLRDRDKKSAQDIVKHRSRMPARVTRQPLRKQRKTRSR